MCILQSRVSLPTLLFVAFIAMHSVNFAAALREFRPWSNRTLCEKAVAPAYPFAYSKYLNQSFDSKGRVNSNKQDFRHECQVRGGKSKCHICEDIICKSDSGTCFLQLQGVSTSNMSVNVPSVSDSAWPVNGTHIKDFGGSDVTHFCVFLTGGKCVEPYNTNFTGCITRCFGHGYNVSARFAQPGLNSFIDSFEGMGKWNDDGALDIWSYPSNCAEMASYGGEKCTYSGRGGNVPSFNPQGFTITIAGESPGFKDGLKTQASFDGPQDVAVDEFGFIYVADTNNHAIRVIDPSGNVQTIAGKGSQLSGFGDGDCADATFNLPKALDVEVTTVSGVSHTIIVVADTGNHRIRMIDYVRSTGDCTVSCLAGLCGNNTLSAVDSSTQATPLSGFADGSKDEARFSTPEGIAIVLGNAIVADTGNFIIRSVNIATGNTSTLAGRLIPAEVDIYGNPLAGCTPPCLKGEQGYRDGNLSYAQFYNPVGVSIGTNNTIWIADDNRVRIIALPQTITVLYTIRAEGVVSTIAGDATQGVNDGKGDEARFFDPRSIYVTNDDVAYVVDSASCKIRRISPLPLVSEEVACDTAATEVIRPSGCTSFEQPVDAIGRKASRFEANILYNYGDPYLNDYDQGRYTKNCVGTPPRDVLDKHFLEDSGDNLVIDDLQTAIREDSEQGMSVIVSCPAGCASSTSIVAGSTWYTESSSICMAAIHSGVISDTGGFLAIELQRFDYLRVPVTNLMNETFTRGSLQNNVASIQMPNDTLRVFRITELFGYTKLVHTVAGTPSAPLQGGCGYEDGQPALTAKFDKPRGIAANKNISNSAFLYIADTGNHRIRGLSAVCTQICENGGSCVLPDKCQCTSGWSGKDCTRPVCDSACGPNTVCVGPAQCGCKPGYRGTNCDVPACEQTCANNGTCVAPNTCGCKTGWFDSNCTTPVCTDTCANGGNCTAPNLCSCPTDWTGSDCRIPVCKQTCKNGGFCVAPDTCICPPQYIGMECTVPVCHQGSFVRNNMLSPNDKRFLSSDMAYWPTYKQCDLVKWCNSTKEFECDQLYMERLVIEVPSGPESRHITGRKERPLACMTIEVTQTYKLPYELENANNGSSGVRRYSEVTPYETAPWNPWRGILKPTHGHTGPWVYTPDRQVAYVNWLNVSQGVYVCANGGNCTAPDTCECAAGWGGFDCRTPICSQGFYNASQEEYVSGQKSASEMSLFRKYMQSNTTYRLEWPYSNPNYTIQWEFYNGSSRVNRETRTQGRERYLGPSDWTGGRHGNTPQGGFRCSIRSVTLYENQSYIYAHPNYYSRYMDAKEEVDGKVYSYWENMSWPAVHQKTRVLDRYNNNRTFIYTNNGWRRYGVWETLDNKWEFGICVIEFKRNCTSKSKQLDLESLKYYSSNGNDSIEYNYDVLVQDPDLAYRPRIYYDDEKVSGIGSWVEEGGECVDQVIRGCYNNGTCVGPDTCQCAEGWTGADCTTASCITPCQHNGMCTLPNTCTCQKGWTGDDCSVPMCAQECQNGGYCVAPDTCKCRQFPNDFRDGSLDGGKPRFPNPATGAPLETGWTGFDCSTPICVQNDPTNGFILNVVSTLESDGYMTFGGHGGDGTLDCLDSSGKLQPRCPNYDLFVTSNDGKTFQSGCGFDPLDTGCCTVVDSQNIECRLCKDNAANVGNRQIDNSTFYCVNENQAGYPKLFNKQETSNIDGGFDGNVYYVSNQYDSESKGFKICGAYHSPRSIFDASADPADEPLYYYNPFDARLSSYNMRSNYTSNRFLCNIMQWEQGDYIDDAGLGSETGVGSIFGLDSGRHIRVNNPYVNGTERTRGEGIYSCQNRGSCVGPDVCTCTDGYSGYDCSEPQCRHRQQDGEVTSCLNQGICSSKDDCECVQTQSILHKVYADANAGTTGWTGSDCSMPICVQGFYDPFCTDLPEAPGGEGCYRCSNGGNCTAPDVCTCVAGWSGYDCKTPICETYADPLTRMQLGTLHEDRVISFESDPCGMVDIYGMRGWKGTKYARGNCTQPNECTCLCKTPYFPKSCHKLGLLCDGPWQDTLSYIRNVLMKRGPTAVFGSTSCAQGYEGNVNELDAFISCHLDIYVPTDTERSSVQIILGMVLAVFLVSLLYYFLAARIRRRMLIAKIERRRSKRSSEESLLQTQASTFKGK